MCLLNLIMKSGEVECMKIHNAITSKKAHAPMPKGMAFVGLLNGRFAMVGLISAIATERVKGHPL